MKLVALHLYLTEPVFHFGDVQGRGKGKGKGGGGMNCLFFTTVFNLFTTDSHFFTTPPSILTTPPSILTTLLCSLKSEICCYLGLGRHAAHKIKISGDALTVSVPNICPSTTTVRTPYVRVICTGAVSQSACRNVPSSHCRYLTESLGQPRGSPWPNTELKL
jgi:hypothetical protein